MNIDWTKVAVDFIANNETDDDACFTKMGEHLLVNAFKTPEEWGKLFKKTFEPLIKGEISADTDFAIAKFKAINEVVAEMNVLIEKVNKKEIPAFSMVPSVMALEAKLRVIRSSRRLDKQREITASTQSACVNYEKTDVNDFIKESLDSGVTVIDENNLIEELTGQRLYEVWTGGYSAAGDTQKAVLHGKYFAEDFRSACELAVSAMSQPEYADLENLTSYGCRFFDNEQDARKMFG